MKYLSVNSFPDHLITIQETLEKEPIILSRENEEIAVILSVNDYKKLLEINKKEFQEFCDKVGQKAMLKGLTEDKLKAILEDE